jgi:drug/metabolite transporter (DMT)-like permease
LRTAVLSRSMSAGDWGQLLLLGFLWGGSFFFARIAVAQIPPLALVLYRVSIAALVLHLWLGLRGISFAAVLDRPGSFLVLALLNNVIPFSLIFSGQTQIGAGLASVFYATTPLWTILVANLLTSDEKLSAAKLAGVALGMAGAAVMIGPGLLSGLGGPAWAKLAVIGAAISYAFAVVYAKRFKDIKPTVVATGQLTVAAILMAPIVFFLYSPEQIVTSSIPIWTAILVLAVFTTIRVHSVFQSHRLCGGNERIPGHVAGASQRDHARRRVSWRKAEAVRAVRDDIDHDQPGHHGWPAASPLNDRAIFRPADRCFHIWL